MTSKQKKIKEDNAYLRELLEVNEKGIDLRQIEREKQEREELRKTQRLTFDERKTNF